MAYTKGLSSFISLGSGSNRTPVVVIPGIYVTAAASVPSRFTLIRAFYTLNSFNLYFHYNIKQAVKPYLLFLSVNPYKPSTIFIIVNLAFPIILPRPLQS